MRSQASKSSPKKGELKTSLKTKKPVKKPVSPKKKKLVSKSLVKGAKKNAPKEDSNPKNDGETAAGDRKETSSEMFKSGSSKTNPLCNESPSRKKKKDPKEKKDEVKTPSQSNVKKTNPKKPQKKPTKKKVVAKQGERNNDVKYKINENIMKKTTPKFSKAKKVVKKGKAGNGNQKNKCNPQLIPQPAQKDKSNEEIKVNKVDSSQDKEDPKNIGEIVESSIGSEEKEKILIRAKEQVDTSSSSENACANYTSDKSTPTNQSDTLKAETERPPKFFTSTRSPRMVDIDVKCCKNSKGNLSVSERFLSMKFETKIDESNKNKPLQNTLVSQGPEIDVYTFTEKVDSPKSILSDFRNPVNKNIGRVRPIARVKGTVIDKQTELEKKKFSPHRPIEEVVKQLKANKTSEELSASQSLLDLSNIRVDIIASDNNPKPIVSKSYKMVARKSSVTGQPFSPIKFLDQASSPSDKTSPKASSPTKKPSKKIKKESKSSYSDDDFNTSKFSLNTKAFQYSSSEESVNESNDESKESSESDASKNKKPKNKRYKKITDSAWKTTSKELKELSKDSLVDLKDDTLILGSDKPSKRRRKLLSMWNGPKKHRMASLNAIAKVHCLYENESRTHMELGLMKTVDRQPIPSTSKQAIVLKKKDSKPKQLEKQDTTSESEYEAKKEKKEESSESSDDSPPQRSLRGEPGIRSAGKYWDPKSSTSSSEDSELESKKRTTPEKKKVAKSSPAKPDNDKPPAKMKKTAGVPIKKKRNRNEVVMDLKDMVVQKRMASLNATAILAASYEKRSSKSSKDGTTSDSCSDESFSQKPKNGVSSGVKSETKTEEPKKEKDCEDDSLIDRKQKVEVIVNQESDVTITGVYSTHHHEGFCTVSGMQYRISSTSHTQTTATANCEKEGCPRDDGARYTPLSALSSMQPPADNAHTHPHPVADLGGLSRRPGCSSAFSAPSPSAHHEPGYYQPAGPLIKEGSADERALARYHPPHYHAPHPPVLPQYGPYYPDLCYGRYYRPPGPYHMPPSQGEAPMGGLGGEPYPPPPYYGTPPCYQHSPQRIPYVEYRGCPCPLNACPKNVLIGPATGKAPAGGGPDVQSIATPGGAFRSKVRACVLDAAADTHGSGKDPPLEPEPPAGADAPHPCPLPAIGGASPKREIFDVRDNIRIASDVRSSEAIGPPSPARGSDGVCAPQPPPCAPRRARLGYYQPAGPLIKEGSADERALARYHPPHYHAPHPPVLPQYGPYYPDLCYGRYYRPPGPYHMPPSQGEAPMGGLGGEPYPPPPYYGTPPCYQHSPQRIPYVEYRGCPCPLNACPKNVLIGPATGKAPAGGGPDVQSIATPGGAFRSKVRACVLDAAADTHGSGKDPPLEPEPPAGADAPHPCPLPAIGGASPKREIFDVRDNIRIASDVRSSEAIGPPSPARGSDGVCAPQPPPCAPRRARLGKAMARRSLAGDDTTLLLAVMPPQAQPTHHSDAEDDVLAISPPLSAPIDLSSSDERSTPLVDIKKENEGPTFASARKPEAQALREHNSTRTTADVTFVSDNNKPVKRRYSRTKLDIDMKDTQLEEGCKTNGIGEHVKLIKRRKVSGDQIEPPRVETITKEPKRKPAQPRKSPKTPPAEKKSMKRKLANANAGPRAKKILLESPSDENPRVTNGVPIINGVPAVKDKDDLSAQKPKTKSALLLDNLIRKNSIDRADAKGYASDKELNPAELFLSPIENIAQNCAKKMLNINNNIVDNANTNGSVRPDTIAAVSQLIGKKLAYKNACKVEKVDSKIMHNVKSVLKPPTVKTGLKEDKKTLHKCDPAENDKPIATLQKDVPKPVISEKAEKEEIPKDRVTEENIDEKAAECVQKSEAAILKSKDEVPAKPETVKESQRVEPERERESEKEDDHIEPAKTKRCKLTNGELKAKNVEKVVKLLVSKRPAIKTDEATLVVEEACASPVPSTGTRRTKRRGSRRGRRPLTLATPLTIEPRAPPRWSNGWNWDGEHHLSKVYLNNDSRLDRMARCWSRMTHASGDKVARGDCVLLRASVARAQPFVARVASLWENPDDGEMMVSLVWYYRPEHTERGREPADAPDEVFASRHRDANSVACIEDKCYVLTFNEYCRYRKRLKAAEEGITITPTIVPPLPANEMNPLFAPNDSKLPPTVSPELVLFCRKIYDFRSKKIHMPNK